MRLDPFIALAMVLTPHASGWPAVLSNVATEPMLLSRACAALCALAALDALLPVLLWSAAALGLTGALKEFQGSAGSAAKVLLACYAIGDCAAFAISLAAAHTLHSRGRAVGGGAATVASLCMLYALLQALRRLLLSIWTLVERAEAEQSELDEEAGAYRECSRERLQLGPWGDPGECRGAAHFLSSTDEVRPAMAPGTCILAWCMVDECTVCANCRVGIVVGTDTFHVVAALSPTLCFELGVG
eukprot:6373265-Prymnesium_polylepis.1